MSQLRAKNKHNGNVVRFGLDHAIGWFYSEEDAAGDEVVAYDQGPFTTKENRINRSKLVELLTENCEMTPRLQDQIAAIAMDLDPAYAV